MGLDVGIVTGKIEYLDRYWAGNDDLAEFLREMLSTGVGQHWPASTEGHAFLFTNRELWEEAVEEWLADHITGEYDEEASEIKPHETTPEVQARADAFRTIAIETFEVAAKLSPHGEDECLLHFNW